MNINRFIHIKLHGISFQSEADLVVIFKIEKDILMKLITDSFDLCEI